MHKLFHYMIKFCQIILAAATAFGVCGVFVSYYLLEVTHFTLTNTKISAPFRIVMISDLHNHTFGRNNQNLVNKIAELQPDLICMTGDFLNGTSNNDHAVINLITQLRQIAPVYYSMGNHELEYCRNGHPYAEFKANLETAGAKVLHHTYEDVAINGNEIRLGGMYEYAFETPMQSKAANKRAQKYLKDYLNTSRYMIMCAHIPGTFASWNYGGKLGIDCVLSGHLHGGQVIIPFVGGLYSQLENFFPSLDYGYYDLDGCDMVVSRGLGSDLKLLPRFCNPPEICSIDIEPE